MAQGTHVQSRPSAGSVLAVAILAVTTLASPALAALSLGGIMAFSRDDIPGSFTTLSGNDATANVTLPFAVAIDGTSYTTLTISTNGWIEFGGNTSGGSDPTNDCLPTAAHTHPFLAAYWDDLLTLGNNIRYGTVGSAGGRVFVADFEVQNNFGANHLMTMQVQIHERSNLITVKYLADDAEANGQTATIGFQGAGGASATAYSITCNGKVLDDNADNEGWSIVPGTPTAPATLHGIMAHSRDDLPAGFSTLTGDDATADVTLPFGVVIDGTSYTTLTISTNGWIEFGGNTSGNSDPTNDCLPTAAHTHPFLAAYWDDLQTITGSATNHIRYGTVGSAGGRTFVADFREENAFGSNHNVDMQVQIHERSNLIIVKYHGNEPDSTGQTATIGFQRAGGASAKAQPLTCNGKILDDNVANEGWSLDPTSPRGGALGGFNAHSRDDIFGFATLSGNDATIDATMPFAVVIEGTSYTLLTISTNGWIEFGGNTSGGSDPSNDCLPTAAHTHPFLAAYWDDLRTIGNHVRFGTVGAAGGQTFVIDFEVENNFGSNHDMNMQVQIHERSNLITVKYLDEQDQADGQTATIGFQTAGGASGTAYPVTCNGKVLDDNTTNSEGWSISPTYLCGDAEVDPGEACDLGTANGSSTSCCTATCGLRAAGSTCRPSAGVCDLADTCSGTSPTCPADDKSTAVCRAAAGICDVAESCNGVGDTCPADDLVGAGTVCRSSAGICDPAETCDGVAVTCPSDAKTPSGTVCRASGGICDPAEACDGLGDTCPSDARTPSGTVCRASGGICDPAEACDGLGDTCPSDARTPSGTVCRPSAGICDPAEACDGVSNACPDNGFQSSTTVCRVSGGPCDPAETCSGTGPGCPADAKTPSGTVCRASAGVCDVAEACDGSSNACPANGFEPSSSVCRASAGVCDPAESCPGSGPGCPADAKSTAVCRASAGICDPAESCDGSSNGCPAESFASSSTVCRTSAGVCDPAEHCTGSAAACPSDAKSMAVCRGTAGVCDVAESCDGSSDACPPDAFESASTQCRASAGVCDPAESCTGSGASCPADGKSTAVCRASAGICDPAENCNGSSNTCPADSLEPTSTLCRAAAGVCDVAEHCTGTGSSCPADSVAGAFVACRAAAGECDLAESCNGVGVNCPADAVKPSGTPCTADGSLCTLDQCDGSSAACQHPAGNGGVVCRASAGSCDVVEICDGSNPACPADGFQPSGTPCRTSAGICDVAESCPGTAAACPADGFQSATTVCRPAAGDCDAAENCTGSSAPCPADAFQPDGTACIDGDACTSPDTCTGGVCGGPRDVTACLDDFLCYKAKITSGTTKFAAVPGLPLQDQFDTSPLLFDVLKPKHLCTPADRDSTGIVDAVTHLESYSIKASVGQPLFVRRTNVKVVNAFGTLHVDTKKPDLLFLPTTKDPLMPPAPPSGTVDHYKCYKIGVTRGTAKLPRGMQTLVADQFTSPPKTFDVKAIKHLCNPVDKNGEGIINPTRHLVCYKVKPAFGQPVHVPKRVFLTNQFGTYRLDTVKEDELCLPSEKMI